MKKRVACFFTAGDTELNAMKGFMRRINPELEYYQLCPRGERKSATAIKTRQLGTIRENRGITGSKLIEFMMDFIHSKRFAEEQYDAILIEDDKDARFLTVNEDGFSEIDTEEWKAFTGMIREQVHEMIPAIPVILFVAAPEVEAWFLSDWENSFGSIYKDVLGAKKNQYFKTRFYVYVQKKILTDAYMDQIESYGFFPEGYRKLSEELQKALEIDIDQFIQKEEFSGGDLPIIRYSKKRHGENMLYVINPEEVYKRCTFFFKEAYDELKKLSSCS